MNWNKTPGAFTSLCWLCFRVDPLGSKGLCSGKSISILGNLSQNWEIHFNSGRSISNLGNPSQIWEIHLNSGKSISNLGNPSQIWEIHLRSGKSIPVLGNPSQIWEIHFSSEKCISVLGNPFQFWGIHLKFGKSISDLGNPPLLTLGNPSPHSGHAAPHRHSWEVPDAFWKSQISLPACRYHRWPQTSRVTFAGAALPGKARKMGFWS